ncbi:hypothetical protein EB001_01190 [bacterium]|nr:hypothetical protein [bacterium]
MANIVKLKHLEHLEDEVLNYGSEGCFAIVKFLTELKNMIGKKSTGGFLQTKWDGAPSVVCGVHPITGGFFVGTKSVFNKKDPKICFTPGDIDSMYENELNKKLKDCLKYFSQLGITGVIQGDLLYTNDKKTQRINDEELVVFRPNTITYGIPTDHPIGQKVNRSKIGVVFHTNYAGGPDLADMSARPRVDISKFNSVDDVAVISNDTQVQQVSFTKTEEQTFNRYIQKINRMCEISAKFHDYIVENSGTTGDAKFFVGSYLKPFFNNEIKEARTINNVDATLKSFAEFYKTKMDKEINSVKTAAAQTKKREFLYTGVKYLEDHQNEFKAFVALYQTIQEAKLFIIQKLDSLEQFRTFVEIDGGYKVTTPEGYVLHQDGDMVKLVNRIEFSKNNFTIEKNWKK